MAWRLGSAATIDRERLVVTGGGELFDRVELQRENSNRANTIATFGLCLAQVWLSERISSIHTDAPAGASPIAAFGGTFSLG